MSPTFTLTDLTFAAIDDDTLETSPLFTFPLTIIDWFISPFSSLTVPSILSKFDVGNSVFFLAFINTNAPPKIITALTIITAFLFFYY